MLRWGLSIWGMVFCFSLTLSAYELEIGTNLRSFDYKETLPDPYKSEESVQFVSLILGARKAWTTSALSLRWEGRDLVESQFDGTTLSGRPVTATNFLGFYDLGIQYEYFIDSEWSFLIGGGWHHWNRFLTGGSGYREIYSWYFWDLGFQWDYYQIEDYLLRVEAHVQQMLNGKIQIIFSETNTNGDDSVLNLGNRAGYRVEFPIVKAIKMTPWQLKMVPWWAFSEIGESNSAYNRTELSTGTLGNIHEPASKTTEYGVKFSALYRW